MKRCEETEEQSICVSALFDLMVRYVFALRCVWILDFPESQNLADGVDLGLVIIQNSAEVPMRVSTTRRLFLPRPSFVVRVTRKIVATSRVELARFSEV